MRISSYLRPLCFGFPLAAQSEFDEEIEELERALEEIKARAQAGDDVQARIQALRNQLDRLEQKMADDDSDLLQQGAEPLEAHETEGPAATSESEGEATQPQAGV